jgi:hypothetical protein
MHVSQVSAFACAWCALFTCPPPHLLARSRTNKRTPARPHPRARTPSRARSLPQVNLGLRGGGLLVKGTPLSWEDSLQVFLRVRAYVRVFVCIMRTRKHTHVLIHSNPEEFARLRRCVCVSVGLSVRVCASVFVYSPFLCTVCCKIPLTHTCPHTHAQKNSLAVSVICT